MLVWSEITLRINKLTGTLKQLVQSTEISSDNLLARYEWKYEPVG